MLQDSVTTPAVGFIGRARTVTATARDTWGCFANRRLCSKCNPDDVTRAPEPAKYWRVNGVGSTR